MEFINILQGGMSVKEYSLKFTKLSKYAPTIVAYPRARMNKFVIGVPRLVGKECHTTMLLSDTDTMLKVYAQQNGESKLMELRQEGIRHRSDEPSQAMYKRKFDNQDSPVGNKDRVSNKYSRGGGHALERSRCTTSGKHHLGKCLARTEGCFGCGNKGQKMTNYPNLKEKVKEIN